VLDLLGLSAAEESVYLALLERGQADAADLAGVADPAAETATVDDSLRSLEARGLIERLPGDAPTRYRMIDPALGLASLVSDREHQLQRARQLVANLSLQHRNTHGDVRPDSLLEVIDDPEVAARYVIDTYSHATREVVAMERPPYGKPNLEPNPIELELLAKGVTHRVLYEQSAVEQPGRLADLVGGLKAGEEARVAPSLPGRLLMVDHRRALLPAKTGGLLTDCLLVVHPGALLDMVAAFFELTWRRSIPLDMIPGAADASGADTDGAYSDEVILSLMAAGLTDRAIARQLTISQRTVQRRIQRICERLGVSTRFQAGLQTAREHLL
jgi:Sugar-specific transcriptional regulator TrmB/Bacterial regulatory proteins, luxR family